MNCGEKTKLTKCSSLASSNNSTNNSFLQKTLSQLPSFFSKQISLTNLNNSTSNIHSIANQSETVKLSKSPLSNQPSASAAASPRKLTSKQKKDRFRSSKKGGGFSFNFTSLTASNKKLSHLFSLSNSNDHNNSNPALAKIVDSLERKHSSSDSEIQAIGTKSERLKRKFYTKSTLVEKPTPPRLKELHAVKTTKSQKNLLSPFLPLNEQTTKAEHCDNFKSALHAFASTKTLAYNVESLYGDKLYDKSKRPFMSKKNYKEHMKKQNVRRRSSTLNLSTNCLNQPKNLNCSKVRKNEVDAEFRKKLEDLQKQQKEFAYAASASLSPTILSPVHMRRRKAFVAVNHYSLNEEHEFDYYFFKDVSIKERYTNIINETTNLSASCLVSVFLESNR